MGEREPEKDFILEVVGRASARPSPAGMAAVAALRRVGRGGEEEMLEETLAILSDAVQAPPWFSAPAFEPVRAWRAADVWESERLLFVEYTCADQGATKHTLMAQITEPGGSMVTRLGVLHEGAAHLWSAAYDPDDVPMPLTEVPIETVLADLAETMRQTDMYWPRHDDEEYVDVRALAWARCRDHLPGWPDFEPLAEERRRLTEEFAKETGLSTGTHQSLVDLFLDYGDGSLKVPPLGWSPGWVELFLGDWLPRKTFLDAEQRAALPQTLRAWVRFALAKREIEPRWIEPVVAAVGECLPDYEAAMDDETSWGPAKEIAAELIERGIDLRDKDAVNDVISQLNAQRLARSIFGD